MLQNIALIQQSRPTLGLHCQDCGFQLLFFAALLFDCPRLFVQTISPNLSHLSRVLTSRKSHKPVGRKEGRNADVIDDNTKKAKSGQAEWEETNEEVT